MNKIIVFALISLFLLSCSKEVNNINVSIEGIPDGRKVTLKKQVESKVISIDSTTVQNGKFGFAVDIKEPMIVGMFIDSVQQGIYPMIGVNDKVNVIAYKDSLHSSKISGSELYDDLKELRDVKNKYTKEMNKYSVQYYAASQSKDSAKINEIKRATREIQDKISLNDWKYITSHPDSHVSAMALQNLFMDPKYQDSLKTAFYNLSEEVQNSEISKRLRDFFEKKKNPIDINTSV